MEDEFFKRTQQAEASRPAETAAAVYVGKIWRGHTVRVVLTSWQVH